MKRYVFLLFSLLLFFNFKIGSQNNFNLINNEGLLTAKEELALGKAIQYEADFFSQLFPDKNINICDIKFTVATNFIDFVNVQTKTSGSTHMISGYFSTKDSSLVVYKDKKASSSRFLSTCYHEMSHAFLSLYAERKYLPPWFNEGLAVYLERMSFDKKRVVQQVDKYKIGRVKTLIELHDINLADFAEWNYQKFSSESFSQESYGYCVGYCMVYFLMQKDEAGALQIFRQLIGSGLSSKVFERLYPGGFAQFEKDFMEYFKKY